MKVSAGIYEFQLHREMPGLREGDDVTINSLDPVTVKITPTIKFLNDCQDFTALAEAAAGAVYDWAHGRWGPMQIDLVDEEGRVVGFRMVDAKEFTSTKKRNNGRNRNNP